MNYIERSKCVISGDPDLELLHSLKDFPVFMGSVKHPERDDITFDMDWYISPKSGLIQLKKLVPLDILYGNEHGSGLVGKNWHSHHKSFAEFIKKSNPNSVFEIGGLHGILAKYFHKLKKIKWKILEPNPIPVEGCEAEFIRGFFNEGFHLNEKFDVYIHSHVFEHMYDPKSFLDTLSKFVPLGKQVVFSVPNMLEMLKKFYTNCINFEHTIFLTEPYLEHLMSSYGFSLIEKEFFLEDHSIFYRYVRKETTPIDLITDELYELNREIFFNFIDHHHSNVKTINEHINKTKNPIFLFGAHIFSQYLIQVGLQQEHIICILDNDTSKQNKRLYGTSLKVMSPSCLSKYVDPIVILKAGSYNEEIKKDILENINISSIFLE